MTSDADPEYDRILGFEEIYEMAVKEVERRRIESDICKILFVSPNNSIQILECGYFNFSNTSAW